MAKRSLKMRGAIPREDHSNNSFSVPLMLLRPDHRSRKIRLGKSRRSEAQSKPHHHKVIGRCDIHFHPHSRCFMKKSKIWQRDNKDLRIEVHFRAHDQMQIMIFVQCMSRLVMKGLSQLDISLFRALQLHLTHPQLEVQVDLYSRVILSGINAAEQQRLDFYQSL